MSFINNNWRREMNEMLEALDRQAIRSLRKIKRFFELRGRPFDERSRSHLLELSNQRYFDAKWMIIFRVH